MLGEEGTILVAEDDEVVREVICRLLVMSGFDVLEAPDGEEALELIENLSGDLDLVLTDLNMPKVGGRELAERLARLRPGTPVLFMSGNPLTSESMDRTLPSGTAFIPKPFSADTLTRKVHELID